LAQSLLPLAAPTHHGCAHAARRLPLPRSLSPGWLAALLSPSRAITQVASSPFLFPVPFTRVASSPVFFALAVAVPPMGWGFGAVPTRSGHPLLYRGRAGNCREKRFEPYRLRIWPWLGPGPAAAQRSSIGRACDCRCSALTHHFADHRALSSVEDRAFRIREVEGSNPSVVSTLCCKGKVAAEGATYPYGSGALLPGRGFDPPSRLLPQRRTSRGARTRDHKVKSLALYRLS
jgi:hypothetical protein